MSGVNVAAMAPEVPVSAPSIQIHSVELQNEYEKVLGDVCRLAMVHALGVAAKVVDEAGKSVHFNIGDICNTLTNLLQAHRASHQ